MKRIEPDIRTIPEREKIRILPMHYAIPEHKGVGHRAGAVMIITDHAADKAQIPFGEHHIICRPVDAGGHIHIELEQMIRRKRIRNHRIECMDPLHNNDIPLRNIQPANLRAAIPSGKIKTWNLTRVRAQKPLKGVLQQRDIQRMDTLEILLSI